MGVVATWLVQGGLGYAVDNFTAAGIVTPDALAELDCTHFEALGVSSPGDRQKLFFLVHRIKMAIKKEREGGAAKNGRNAAKPESHAEPPSTRVLTAREEELAAIVAAKIEQSQSHGESSEQQVATSPAKTPTKSPKSSPSKIPAPSNSRSPSRLTPPRSTGLAKKQNSTSTSPGETTTPSQNRKLNSTRTGSQDIGAKDEIVNDDTADIRRSKRIVQKSTKGESSVTTNKSPQQTPAETRTSKLSNGGVTKPSESRTGSAPKKSLTGSTVSANPSVSRRSSSGLKTPQPKSKVSLGNSNTSSALPQPSRLTSKLHNPSKSTRTGKQLSSIPADEVLPMSPMIPPNLENEENNGTRQRKPNLVQPKSLSCRSLNNNSLASSGKYGGTNDTSDGEESDAESVGGSSISSRGSRSLRGRRTTTGGSSSTNRNRRATDNHSTSGNVSDSDSSVKSSKRRRSMGVPAPKTKSKLVKGRASDVASTTRRPVSATASSTTRTSAGQTSNQTKKGPGKGAPSMTIKGGITPELSFKAQIAALREKVAFDHEVEATIFQDDDDDDDDDHMIRVIVRKRPFNKQKSPDGIDAIQALEYGDYGKMLVYQPITRVDLTKEVQKVPFCFDGVFDEEYDNAHIYNKSVRNMIPVVLDGQHATVFAFGATGSG